MEDSIYDIAVIGAGAVGLSAAYKLTKAYPGLKLIVLEKEPHVAAHQTGHNSGVLHSGIYYKPGSLKARNCITGREELVAFAAEHRVAHDVCGKVVVATAESELPQLEKIYANSHALGLEKTRRIDLQELRAIEPHASGIAALFVPYTGIIDYVGMCETLARLITQNAPQSAVLTGRRVEAISNEKDLYRIQVKIISGKEHFRARHLITCAGLQSDRLARMEGLVPESRIVGFRGDYYDLTHEAAKTKVRNLIYPVPNPQFPFLGVHFTRMIQGGVECGPNAVFTFKREGYGKLDFNLRDSSEALGFKGTWQLFFRHWQYGLGEYYRAFSKAAFLKAMRKLVPSLNPGDLVPGRSGVRAMALGPDGAMLDDFVFAGHERSIHVLNAPSPAATACLAIGSDLCKMAAERFGLD